ncbi:patatin-like phospholipase family protein [Bradyrhizobium sp. Bra78]|uniref:patatin-like phospholipase family protein n=1 Tax=Bradyrhizobium sp. Bra78 TaxID=2926010 RepID=UPI0021C58D7D|nr:patatin-like phospholipase family protein [Bradyrhizobium sp. Bra78]
MTPDQLAAHDLLSELRTRIATQRLPYQHGLEASALKSLRDIFDHARKAMKDHPGCSRFAQVATNMLNVDLRPFTAKWHRAQAAGLLDSRDGANEFRYELDRVRERLVIFAEELQVMAYGAVTPDAETPDALSEKEIEECFEPLKFGVEANSTVAQSIFDDEAKEIAARRHNRDLPANTGADAVGLALSGGGIRSATFCLGVIQVLAQRGLMKYVDYLSTVSGGGYTGAFVTSLIGSGQDFDQLANPYGPDTDPVRHVRQNAKYLSIVDLKSRWTMVVGTIAGLILNWSAPLALLSGLAIFTSLLSLQVAFWANASLAFGGLTILAVIIYGISLKFGLAKWPRMAIALVSAIALCLVAIAISELGFAQFESMPYAIPIALTATFSVVATPVAIRFLPIFRTEAYRRVLFGATLYAAGIIVPVLALLSFYALRHLAGQPTDAHAPWWTLLHYTDGFLVLLTVTAVAGLFSVFVLDVNLTGPHKLYRDQLAQTFIWPSGTTELALSDMNPNQRAPYHLINATVNLPSSQELVLRDRKGDFFLFSKHWAGSTAVKYKRSSCWQATRSPMDLATAMAISGAAASPQMGLGSAPSLSALMTLLNIRLGFWIANPQKFSPITPPGFSCILKEMTGWSMSEKQAWLNVSDGGHIENMGLYELLRRRCKFIICVDGEADPDSTFHGQLTLVRHAQIDLGVRIEPHLDEMRPDPKSRYSKTHAQLFRIKYPERSKDMPAGMGLLLYLKLSLTGDEAELLKRYRLVHPDFPHQSTIDQFYDEEQFEAYRQLGVHVAEGTFAPALVPPKPTPPDVREWFQHLAANMLEPSRR